MFPYVKKKIEVEIRGKMKALLGFLPINRSVVVKHTAVPVRMSPRVKIGSSRFGLQRGLWLEV